MTMYDITQLFQKYITIAKAKVFGLVISTIAATLYTINV